MTDYTAKFKELSKYATPMVPTNQAQKLRYMHRLRPFLAQQVDSGETGPQIYHNDVQRALRIDGWKEDRGGGKNNKFGKSRNPGAPKMITDRGS